MPSPPGVLAKLDPDGPACLPMCQSSRLSSPESLNTFECEALLRHEFDGWLKRLPASMVGLLGGNGRQLMMPLQAVDGRALTWNKWVDELISKIVNNPQSSEDCWLVKGYPGDTAGYPTKKLAARGNQNKWLLHRMTYFVMRPNDLGRLSEGLHCSHRCNRGRFDYEKCILHACINPHHISLTTLAQNQDHKYCVRSMAAWCPHRPRCIYTDVDGRFLPCRNMVIRTEKCLCGRDCFGDLYGAEAYRRMDSGAMTVNEEGGD